MPFQDAGAPAAPRDLSDDLRDRLAAVEAVTFDVGSTLLFHPFARLHKERRSAVKKWLRAHGAPTDRHALRSAISDSELLSSELIAAGAPDAKARAGRQLADALRLRLTPAEARELEALLGALSGSLPYATVPGAAAVLRTLRDHGLKLGIVSNRGSRTGSVTMRYLDGFGLAGAFTPAGVAWSDEVGCDKPDPRIFAAALRGLETPAGRVAHVGNSKRSDVVGAHRAGLLAIRYAGTKGDPGDGPEADAVIQTLDELPGLLGLPALSAAA